MTSRVVILLATNSFLDSSSGAAREMETNDEGHIIRSWAHQFVMDEVARKVSIHIYISISSISTFSPHNPCSDISASRVHRYCFPHNPCSDISASRVHRYCFSHNPCSDVSASRVHRYCIPHNPCSDAYFCLPCSQILLPPQSLQ